MNFQNPGANYLKAQMPYTPYSSANRTIVLFSSKLGSTYPMSQYWAFCVTMDPFYWALRSVWCKLFWGYKIFTGPSLCFFPIILVSAPLNFRIKCAPKSLTCKIVTSRMLETWDFHSNIFSRSRFCSRNVQRNLPNIGTSIIMIWNTSSSGHEFDIPPLFKATLMNSYVYICEVVL